MLIFTRCFLQLQFRLDFVLKRNKKKHGEASERLEMATNQKVISRVSYNTLGSLILELKVINAYFIGFLLNDVTIRSTKKIYLRFCGLLARSRISHFVGEVYLYFSFIKQLYDNFFKNSNFFIFFRDEFRAAESAVEAILIPFTVMSNVLESIFKIAIQLFHNAMKRQIVTNDKGK